MPVSYEKRGHVAVVTLSRPEGRNAWGQYFVDGVESHFEAMEADDEVRCAVLAGDEAPGVLKRNLPRWLAEPGLADKVLAIRPALPQHGGEGAFYVLLRRSR